MSKRPHPPARRGLATRLFWSQLLGLALLGDTGPVDAAPAPNATVAGRFHVEHPTLESLGFEWSISGDADRDATVAVEFRAVGTAPWRPALPLLRIGGERVGRDAEHLAYVVPHGFAGSILGLRPGTDYECRLTLRDPDGASGKTQQLVRVRTRTEPTPSRAGRTLHVYRPEHKGPRQEPAFSSLLEAYYGAGLGDWNVVWERRARPGDTILVHAVSQACSCAAGRHDERPPFTRGGDHARVPGAVQAWRRHRRRQARQQAQRIQIDRAGAVAEGPAQLDPDEVVLHEAPRMRRRYHPSTESTNTRPTADSNLPSKASLARSGKGTVRTNWRSPTFGRTWSSRLAAPWAILRPKHDGQNALDLHGVHFPNT